jgi:signal transduction histidine kinase
VAYQARKVDVVIAVDTPADLPPVRGDRSQVMQILLNLSSNAIEAMAGRGGQLSLRAGVRGESGRQGVRVEVADTGPGIPPETLVRIWEPFFTTKAKGTGLGLSIVRGLVAEQPGAALDVESQPGRGTTFTLTFPITQCSPEDRRSKGAP